MVFVISEPLFVTTEHLPMTEDRYRVQSVERAFALLEALAEAGPEGMTLSSLARSLGVSKSTAYAILQTLLAKGFAADSGEGMSRRYRLGMALARLGEAVTSQIALRDVAMPVIRTLTAETGLTSRVAVLDEPHAVVIASVDAAAEHGAASRRASASASICTARRSASRCSRRCLPRRVREIVAARRVCPEDATITDEPALQAGVSDHR